MDFHDASIEAILASGKEIAKLTREFTLRGCIADANILTVKYYDKSMDPKLKACLLGSLFVIDFGVDAIKEGDQ